MKSEDVEAIKEDHGDEEAMLGDRADYRTQIKEKFCITWNKTSLLGESADFNYGITQKNRKLLEHAFDVNVKTHKMPKIVLLLGAAGIGKTTLLRKVMVDWAEGNLYHQFTYVFYLNGREISQLKERSFAQLISKDWPSTEIPIEKILSQPSSILFIIDSFDELNFAFEEPEFALCGDWTQEHPVSFLMSSLLRKVMLPESFLLVTTRITTLNRLHPLLKKPLSVRLKELCKNARMDYIHQFLKGKTWATNAARSIRKNARLFSMCRIPLVCWLVCTSLKQQVEKGGSVAETCQTTTALFTCYICSLFPRVDGHSANLPNETVLRSLCQAAANGIWTMTHVLYRDSLRKHELTRSDISVFLEANVLQKDTECENCYVFTHLHVQEFFAAMFYLLRDNLEGVDYPFQLFENLNVLLQSEHYHHPHLAQMKCFLFGLLNKDRIKQLEETFNITISLEIKKELLQCLELLGNDDSFPSQLRLEDLFHCLYEIQDEVFTTQAMSYFPKVTIKISEEINLLVFSFCLKLSECLQTIKLTVTALLDTIFHSYPTYVDRVTHGWQDLFSALHNNEDLRELCLYDSTFDELMMNILSQELRHPNCKLQKLVLRAVNFLDYSQDFSFLPHNQNLIHLDLKDMDMQDKGLKSLCDALKCLTCELQKLRLTCCDLKPIHCLHLSEALIRNKRLVFLNLSTNNLSDDGVKLLCKALEHPDCCLERLSLANSGLTKVGCEDLSLALISNKRLTHLCLADNFLGDDGITLISDALKYPQCTLKSLVLRSCHFTPLGSEYLSTSLLHNKSLTHLDLGSNSLQDSGAKLLFHVLQQRTCNLQELELMGCILTSECCVDLVSALVNNPNLCSLQLGNNNLKDTGVHILCDALRNPNCNIQRLGLEHCGLTSACCQDLSTSLHGNQKLLRINLTKNTLGYEGIRNLCEVLGSPECKLEVLGLDKEKVDEKAKKLLEAVRVNNPLLVIKSHYDNEGSGCWWQYF
uniref:NLR family, pyrin domain containing 14 n=1 Tax=Nannospalax galili TaxID=1026970 RepID=A0A8C6RP83_NANGA